MKAPLDEAELLLELGAVMGAASKLLW